MKFSKRRSFVEICPCGKSNKDGKFVPYEGYTDCGYCHSCNQTFLPKKRQIPIINPVSEITFDLFRGSLKGYANNRFIQYLLTLFDPPSVKQVVERYFVGSSDYWHGATVFWQVDENGKIRTGKIILYDPETGKRVKEPNRVHWIHSVMKIPDFNLKQCLFGTHLLPEYPNLPIGLVESEKTAVIASVYVPDVLWLATGGKANLNLRLLEPLKGRRVTLFPDTNAFAEWTAKIKELQKSLPQTYFSVSDVLEEANLTDDERKAGLDIADFLVREKPTGIASQSLENPVNIPETVNKPESYKVLTEYIDTTNPVPEPVFYPYSHPIYASVRAKYPQRFDENGLIEKRRKELKRQYKCETDFRHYEFGMLLEAFGLKDALVHVERVTKIHAPEKYTLYLTYSEFLNRLVKHRENIR